MHPRLGPPLWTRSFLYRAEIEDIESQDLSVDRREALLLHHVWGFSFAEQYEIEDSLLEAQSYELHRDLTSWVASLGVNIRDNDGEKEFGMILTFTLKDLPSIRMPFSLDANTLSGTGSRNR